MIEKTLSSKGIYDGRVFKVRLDTVLLPDGTKGTREIVEHAGAAAGLPVTEDGRFILVRQFRQACGEITLEIPAGKLSPGENPRDCIERELAEETGQAPGRLTPTVSLWPAVGYSSEVIHLFLAEDLHPVEAAPDDDEFIETVLVEPEEALAMALDGRIRDSKTLIAIMLYALGKF